MHEESAGAHVGLWSKARYERPCNRFVDVMLGIYFCPSYRSMRSPTVHAARLATGVPGSCKSGIVSGIKCLLGLVGGSSLTLCAHALCI